MSTTNGKPATKFNGSVLINLNVAQTAINRAIQQTLNDAKLNVNPVELHIIGALLEKDGIFASQLAAKVGRAATSFTPNLDKLQNLGLIERRADKGDRRAVNIHLTKAARDCEKVIRDTLDQTDEKIRKAARVSESEWQTFQKVLAALQSIE